MSTFYLPDLGEGLPDAEIHEWLVKEGETVTTDQPIVSMETAKAVVDVPSPQDGIIQILHGKSGDVIKTGAPLVTFKSEEKPTESNTVVGNIEENTQKRTDTFTVSEASGRLHATSNARALARKFNIPLNQITNRNADGIITKQQVEAFIQDNDMVVSQTTEQTGFEPLHGLRRSMAQTMQRAHNLVVPVSIFDNAYFFNSSAPSDLSVHIIRAIEIASQKEPALNAWFDAKNNARKLFETLNLGLAIDSDDGLLVPVINETQNLDDKQLRQTINQLKTQAKSRSLKPEQFKNATITLSNFGKFAGQFASPVVVPPTVAIIAVGRMFEGCAVKDGKIEICAVMPISLTFDHQAITGGEATRFLGAFIEALTKT